MSVTLVVLVVASVVASAMWALTRSAALIDPADPAEEERWLVGWIDRHPPLAARLRTLDRRVAGGMMLAVAFVVVFATALGVGLLLDMVDRGSGLARWDDAVADWGSRNATQGSTALLEIVTDLGGTLYLLVIAVLLAGFDYWRRRNVNVPLFLLMAIGGVVVINNGLRLLVGRERPPVEQLVGASGASFPSGHSSAAAAAWLAFALVLGRTWPRRWRAVTVAAATVVALAVAASRALLGVHWLTDVLAGTMVGWGWFLLSALAFGGRLQRMGEPVQRLGRRRRRGRSGVGGRGRADGRRPERRPAPRAPERLVQLGAAGAVHEDRGRLTLAEPTIAPT